MRQRFVIFAVIGLVLVLVGEWDLRNQGISSLSKLNDFWLEFCIGNAGDKLKEPAISIVRIDDGYEPLKIGEDDTAVNDGKLSRLDFATILGFVGKMNPRSVVFLPTPTFDEKLVLNQTDIVPLKDAAMQLPKFIVATTISNDGEQAKEAAAIDYTAIKVEGTPDQLLSFTRTVSFPDPQILQNGIPAFRSIESARDLTDGGTIRIPLVAKRGETIVPSLVLAAVANHAAVGFDKITLNLTGKQPILQVGEAYTIPISADGTMILPKFSGISQTMTSLRRGEDGAQREKYQFTSLTAEELAYTGEKDDEVAKRILQDFQPKFDSLKENLVVIGFDRTPDRRITTASGEVLSETGLLARAMAVIQSGRYIELWSFPARLLFIALIGLIALYLFKLPRAKFVPAAIVAALVFFTVTVILFNATLRWTPPFVMMALFALIFVIGLLIPDKSAAKQSA
jgi:hypothetical protein